MKTLTKFVALMTAAALFSGQIQAQECTPACGEPVCCDDSAAYYDCGRASYWSAAIPIGAIVVAAIIIASTNNGHHHKHSSGNGGGHHRNQRRSHSSSALSHH